MFSEVHLRQALELGRVPVEVVVVPGHPHPGVDRQDRSFLVNVEVNHGHAQFDNDGLKHEQKMF